MKNLGFTLIETLVALAILTVAISGAFFAANNALVAASIARDQLTASYLAQEGIEYVRLIRDNAYLANSSSPTWWDDFLQALSAGGCTSATGCQLDPLQIPSLMLKACLPGGCSPLYLATNTTNNYAYYTEQISVASMTVMPTPFTRYIQASSITPTDEQIVSTVTWSYHGRTYTVSAADHLTPWQ